MINNTFKVGDIVKVPISGSSVEGWHSEGYKDITQDLIKHGSVTVKGEFPSEIVHITPQGVCIVKVSTESQHGYTTLGWEPHNLVLMGRKNSKIMSVPIVKHIVLKDSCSNVIGTVQNSYDKALEIAKPSLNDGQYTIYELVPISTVRTEQLTRVSKIKPSKPKIGRPKKIN